MKVFCTLAVLYLAVVNAATVEFPSEISFVLDYELNGGVMDGTLSINATSWAGFGFSSSGTMASTDLFVVGEVDKGIYTGTSAGYSAPVPDDQARLLSQSVDNNGGAMEYSFSLDISDGVNQLPYLVYAYSPSRNVAYHSVRGFIANE